MDNLVILIKEWHPVAQFIIVFILAFSAATISVMVFNGIERFFNTTLPILVRGWPPGHEEIVEEDEE